MALVDSATSFEKRCDELLAGLRQKLVAQSIDWFAVLAFALGSPQNQVSDSDMTDFAAKVFGDAATLGNMSVLRRLHFEACTLLMADMKHQVTSVDASEPLRKLPFVEKQTRLSAQKKRLVGLSHRPEQQPSHQLIDACFHMVETGALTYIPPSKCNSREQEIQADARQKSKQVLTLEAGSLKQSTSSNIPDVDTSTELKLFFALQRRNLAFEIVSLFSWELCATWLDKLMATLISDSPSAFSNITMTQVLRADREIFSIMASEHTGSLKASVGAKPPLDDVFQRLMHDPRINMHLIAMPKQSSAAPKRPAEGGTPPPPPAKHPRLKLRRSDSPKVPPELAGLHMRTKDNKPLCWHFNLAKGCNNTVSKGRCRCGMHLCMKCLKSGHGANQCPEMA